MSGSINQFTFVGRLGATPELRYTSNNTLTVTTLRLATKDNEKTTWHNVTVWNKQANLFCQFLRKGATVAITGMILEKSAGPDTTWTIPELVATRVEFL